VLRSDLSPDVSVGPSDGPLVLIKFSRALFTSRKVNLDASLTQINTGCTQDRLSADDLYSNIISITRENYPPILWVGSKAVDVKPSVSLILLPHVSIRELKEPVLCDGRDDTFWILWAIDTQIHIYSDLTCLFVLLCHDGDLEDLSIRSVLQGHGCCLIESPGEDAVALRMLLITEDSIKVELGGGFFVRF